MKKSLIAAGILALSTAGFCGMTFGPPEVIDELSGDREFRVKVLPPTFKNNLSYSFFQNEDFVSLTAAEGIDGAERASVRMQLYRMRSNGEYSVMWARSLPKPVIPEKVHLLVANELPVIVLEGVYGQVSKEHVQFSIFNHLGHCLTNGSFIIPEPTHLDSLEATSWRVSEKRVILEIAEGRAVRILSLE